MSKEMLFKSNPDNDGCHIKIFKIKKGCYLIHSENSKGDLTDVNVNLDDMEDLVPILKNDVDWARIL